MCVSTQIGVVMCNINFIFYFRVYDPSFLIEVESGNVEDLVKSDNFRPIFAKIKLSHT